MPGAIGLSSPVMESNTARILVVDDSPTGRKITALAVIQLGYECTVAKSGAEAIDQLQNGRFDLVLLDLLMPEMDGFTVLQHIRDIRSGMEIPVVVVSASDDLESVARCIAMGAEDFLIKPLNAVLLKARISACLEKKRLRDSIVERFGKYVPEKIANDILTGQDSLEPRRSLATILFTDLENFTGIAESVSPQQVFEMLNAYFTAAIEPILDRGGVINQFQGDAMLVTFNVPTEDPHHADSAVQAAMEIQQRTRGKFFAGISVNTRIGINTGEVIAGNVGAGSQYNYTVHGDAVNLAARLEQLNKQFKSDILISENTRAMLSKEYPLTSLGLSRVRGKHTPIGLFKLSV